MKPQVEMAGTALIAMGGVLAASALQGGTDLGSLSLGDIIDYAARMSGPSAMLIGIVGFIRGWFVPQYVHQDVKHQRDAALELLHTLTAGVQVQQQTTDKALAATRETANVTDQVIAVLKEMQKQQTP